MLAVENCRSQVTPLAFPFLSLPRVGRVRSRHSGWLWAGRSGDRIPVGGDIFRTCPDGPWGPPSLLCNWHQVFPGDKERPGRDADPSPLLVPWSRKGRAIPLLPLWAVRPVQSLSACTRVHFTGRTACTEPQCLYKGALYRPYGLYRASVPVQGCTLSAVRPVQSLSACRRVHFTLPHCLYKGALYLHPL